MKKIFSLFAAVLFAGSMMAESYQIRFTEAATAGTLDGTTFGTGLTLSVTDNHADPSKRKVAVDGNNAKFGFTAEDAISFTMRLKTGAKSSTTNNLTLVVPEEGTLTIYARTGSSSATDRNFIIANAEDTVVNHICLDTDTVVGASPKVFLPVVIENVPAGTYNITYPINSINFYGFDLEVGAPTSDWDGTVTLSKENITSIADLEGITLTFNGAATLTLPNAMESSIALQNEDGSELYALWAPVYDGTYVITDNTVTLSGWYTDYDFMAPLPAESANLYIEDYYSFAADGLEEVLFETAEIAYEAAPATTYTVTYTVNGFDEEYCSVYACYYNVGFDNVIFVDGANTVPENMLAYISTVVIDGYTVEVKVDGEVVTLTNGNWQSEITADMTIEVTFAAPGETTSTSETIKYSNFVQDDATATSYQNFTYASTSGATYKAHMMLQNGKDSLQIRSTQTASTYYAGIVNTVAPQGKYIKSVSVEWHSGTADTRQLNIFTVDAPMAINDMYAQSATPNYTTLKSAGDKKIEVEGKHSYIGLCSQYGAMYIKAITIEWAENDTPTGLQNVEAVKATKALVNGQVVIFRGDKRFNLVGAKF